MTKQKNLHEQQLGRLNRQLEDPSSDKFAVSRHSFEKSLTGSRQVKKQQPDNFNTDTESDFEAVEALGNAKDPNYISYQLTTQNASINEEYPGKSSGVSRKNSTKNIEIFVGKKSSVENVSRVKTGVSRSQSREELLLLKDRQMRERHREILDRENQIESLENRLQVQTTQLRHVKSLLEAHQSVFRAIGLQSSNLEELVQMNSDMILKSVPTYRKLKDLAND